MHIKSNLPFRCVTNAIKFAVLPFLTRFLKQGKNQSKAGKLVRGYQIIRVDSPSDRLIDLYRMLVVQMDRLSLSIKYKYL
jgi:hypothetical protein